MSAFGEYRDSGDVFESLMVVHESVVDPEAGVLIIIGR